MIVLFICLKMGLGQGAAGGDANAGTLPLVGVGR